MDKIKRGQNARRGEGGGTVLGEDAGMTRLTTETDLRGFLTCKSDPLLEQPT
jgi:hypothetical protein